MLLALDGASRGATWTEDNNIIFATALTATGLQRISGNGGRPEILTTPDRQRGEADHLWPQMLPGNEAVLFTITPLNGNIDASQIAVLDLRDPKRPPKIVLLAAAARRNTCHRGIPSTPPGGRCAPFHSISISVK